MGGKPNKPDTQVSNAMLGESTAFGAENHPWGHLVAWAGKGKTLGPADQGVTLGGVRGGVHGDQRLHVSHGRWHLTQESRREGTNRGDRGR